MITTGLLTLECLKHFFKSRQSCWSIAKTRTNVSSADVSSMTCKEAPRQILCWKCYQTPKNIFNQSAQSDKSFVICWKKTTYWASVVRGIGGAQEESFLVKVDVISTRGKWDVVNGVSQDIIRKGVVFN